MLLSSVILVLREVLEAALLFSLLMVISRWFRISFRWVGVALVIGLLGALIYGSNIDRVSEWFDGVGQEVVNAALQIMIYGLLCIVAGLALRQSRGSPIPASRWALLMISIVALAMTREGSEIMIYLSGFLRSEDQRGPVLIGSVIGAGIGMSVGAVFYYALLNLERRTTLIAGAVLLALVAAGMVSQATQLLIQADWLPAQYPVWDSTWLVSEQTVTGQLLYALFGYEASPTSLQLQIYCASLALLVVIALSLGRRHAWRETLDA